MSFIVLQDHKPELSYYFVRQIHTPADKRCLFFLSAVILCAASSLSSNYRTNCWFISLLWSNIFVLHVAGLNGDNLFSVFSRVFSHTSCVAVQICSFRRANSASPFHFLLFLSLLTPLTLHGFSYNVRSHRGQTFPLPPLVSPFVLLFSIPIPSSPDFGTLAFLYSLPLFSLS